MRLLRAALAPIRLVINLVNLARFIVAIARDYDEADGGRR